MSHSTTVRGSQRHQQLAEELAVVVEVCSAPRYIFRLPIMWTRTKPIMAMPVSAMAYFLPTAVPYRSRRKSFRRFLPAVAVPAKRGRAWRLPVPSLSSDGTSHEVRDAAKLSRKLLSRFA